MSTSNGKWQKLRSSCQIITFHLDQKHRVRSSTPMRLKDGLSLSGKQRDCLIQLMLSISPVSAMPAVLNTAKVERVIRPKRVHVKVAPNLFRYSLLANTTMCACAKVSRLAMLERQSVGTEKVSEKELRKNKQEDKYTRKKNPNSPTPRHWHHEVQRQGTETGHEQVHDPFFFSLLSSDCYCYYRVY